MQRAFMIGWAVAAGSLPATSIHLLSLPKGEPAAEAFAARAAAGQALHAMVTVPEANSLNGTLLDPRSLEIRLNGTPQEHFLLYRSPSVALAFTVVEPKALGRENELSVTARLLEGSDLAAGWRLPFLLTDDQLAQQQRGTPSAGSRVIRVLGPDGPVVGARVFGQRREDLLAAANPEGWVSLTAPSRNSVEEHLAWAPGHWAEAFDPLRLETVTLTPREGTTKRRNLRLDLRSTRGVPMRGLVVVNHLDWYVWNHGESIRVTLRTDAPNRLQVLLPGHDSRSLQLDSEEDQRTVWME
jgi:hypothetical protein